MLPKTREIGDNVYAFTVATLIRDYVKMAEGSPMTGLRLVRILYAFSTVAVSMLLQCFVLYAVWHHLAEPQVKAIRHDYSQYVGVMYGEANTHKDSFGFLRPKDGASIRDASFDQFTEDQKTAICQLPFAHPVFSFTLLLIWTLTCTAELRKTLDLSRALLVYTPTTALDMCVKEDDDVTVVDGLTFSLKLLLAVVGLLPPLLTCMALNYFGCRWLLATNHLNELVLNALALEFVLVLPELLYKTMATKRSMRLTETTLVKDWNLGEISLCGIIGSLSWTGVAAIWVYLYIFHLQQVLPDYHWDVRQQCDMWENIHEAIV